MVFKIDIIASIASSDIVSSKLVPVFSNTYIPAMSNGKYNYYWDENSLNFIKITTPHLIKANNAYLSINENVDTIEL